MVAVLKIYDTTNGRLQGPPALELRVMEDSMSVEELIRRRVETEVQRYNAEKLEYFNGLVAPTDAEQTLNGFKLRERRQIDVEAQIDRALQAFDRNGFFLLVGDRQVESRDERIPMSDEVEVSFYKLMPLVGG